MGIGDRVQRAQLFDRGGTLVGTVNVTLNEVPGGFRWPDAIRTSDGRIFTMNLGRYVWTNTEPVNVGTVEPPKES